MNRSRETQMMKEREKVRGGMVAGRRTGFILLHPTLPQVSLT